MGIAVISISQIRQAKGTLRRLCPLPAPPPVGGGVLFNADFRYYEHCPFGSDAKIINGEGPQQESV